MFASQMKPFTPEENQVQLYLESKALCLMESDNLLPVSLLPPYSQNLISGSQRRQAEWTRVYVF